MVTVAQKVRRSLMIRLPLKIVVLLFLISSIDTPAAAQNEAAKNKAVQNKTAQNEAAQNKKGEVPPSKYKRRDRVVLTATSKLLVPERTVGELRKGVVVTVLATNGPWIWVRSGSAGWLDSKYVVPLDEGVDHFTAVLAQNKNDSSSYEARAHVYRNLGNHARAIEDYSAAIKLQSSDAFVLKNRAYTYFLIGNHEAAAADYTSALQLNPKDVTAWKDRGHNHYLSGDYAKALADYDAALKLNPKHIRTLNFRAWLLATCPDSKIRNGKEAMKNARLACELSKPTDYDFVDTLAAAYASAGYFDLAIETAREAIKQAPEKERPSIEQRLKRYGDKKPYLESRPAQPAQKS
ncbi:MAG: tetratricopeptide repeat protein [Pirellulales bacterium]